MRNHILLNSFLTLLIFSSLLMACGKKGMPVPMASQEAFSWISVAVAPNAGCMNIDARLQGSTRNIASLTLEVEPLDGQLCEECPFSPKETAFIPVSTAQPLGQTEASGTSYQGSFCPQIPAPAYRIRVVARSVLSRLPDQNSSIQMVVF